MDPNRLVSTVTNPMLAGHTGSQDGLSTGTPDISIVIPIYNEAEAIPALYQRLKRVLEGILQTWELIFVDDGSRDNGFQLLKAISLQDHQVRVVRFRRNFGQTPAMVAGFKYAQGRVIITMDGDMQNDPVDIPRLLEKLEEGYDIVSGWRKSRKDPFLSRRLPSQIANKLVSRLTGVRLHDYGCSLKAYRREVIEHLHLYGDLHRFIPAVASAIGAEVAEIEVDHHPRQFGKSKYGLGRTVRVILDLIALKLLQHYMTRPMHLFGLIGLLALAGGLLSGTSTIAMKALMGVDITGNPLLYLTVLLLLVGVQFVSLGFLGEISVRTYHESQQKPIYFIREVVNPAMPVNGAPPR